MIEAPDRSETEDFIRRLTGDVSTPIDWAVFDESKPADPRKAWRRRGTLAEMWEALSAANASGCGIFYSVQILDGRGFTADHVTAPRAVYIDDDSDRVTWEDVEAAGLKPSITIQSNAGIHALFLVVLGEGEDLGDVVPCNKALAAKFRTDPKVSDLPRVLRCPGFWHKKNPTEPFLVYVLPDGCSGQRHTFRQLVEAFDLSTAPAVEPERARGSGAGLGEIAAAMGVDDRIYASREDRIRRAKAYLKAVPPARQGHGGDAHTLHVATVIGVDFDLFDDDDALEAVADWNELCEPPWEERDLLTKFRNARRYAKGFPGSKCAAEERRPPKVENDDASDPAAGAEGEAPTEEPSRDPFDANAGRSRRPAWISDRLSEFCGPLVNYNPVKRSKNEDEVDKTDEAQVEAQRIAEDQDLNEAVRTDTKWEQVQPSADRIAQTTPLLLRYTNHRVYAFKGIGLQYYDVSEDDILIPSTKEQMSAAAADCCRAMMGGYFPTPPTINTASQLLEKHPIPGHKMRPFRWANETGLALHVIVPPKEGPHPAWDEFTVRCSDPDVFKAWVWSCFLPEEQTGREALILWGIGQNGKSVVADTVAETLGPLAASSEILKGENRFSLEGILNKRLVYFGDVMNPNPLKYREMKEIISGANLAAERKNKAIQTERLHPRVLITSNIQMRISASDPSEMSRVRKIDVKAPETPKEDFTWPKRLRAEMPAFLFSCRATYDRIMKGRIDNSIPNTPACIQALEGGAQAMREDFEYLSTRLEFTPAVDEETGEPILKSRDFVTCQRMAELFDGARLSKWEKVDARKWLRNEGAIDLTPAGKPIRQRIDKGKEAVAVWHGVRELSLPSSGPIFKKR